MYITCNPATSDEPAQLVHDKLYPCQQWEGIIARRLSLHAGRECITLSHGAASSAAGIHPTGRKACIWNSCSRLWVGRCSMLRALEPVIPESGTTMFMIPKDSSQSRRQEDHKMHQWIQLRRNMGDEEGGPLNTFIWNLYFWQQKLDANII